MRSRPKKTESEVGFGDPKVAAAFQANSKEIRSKLMWLRRLIFETASATEGVGEIEETLKWGQPSYLTPRTKSGSTIRIGAVCSDRPRYAMYFHCRTDLIATFREIYPEKFRYEGNRGIVFGSDDSVDEAALRHCISLALTYHLRRASRPASTASFTAARRSR